MDNERYALVQHINSKRGEVAILARDLASKKSDLAQLEADLAASNSRTNLKFAEAPVEESPTKKSSK